MRVAIAGAGAVGRSIAQDLLDFGHTVLLIERRRPNYRPDLVPSADWMLADACEVDALRRAELQRCDVVIAATGDDKVNLVFSLLCKTELAVPRVVARINDPADAWLFTEAWGVDVAVSTPGTLVTAVDAAVTSGAVVPLITLQHGAGSIVEVTLEASSPLIGSCAGDLRLPHDAVLVALERDGVLITATADVPLRAGDELVLAAADSVQEQIRAMFQ